MDTQLNVEKNPLDGDEKSKLETIAPEENRIESRIGIIGERLAKALRDVIEAVPGGPHRPQELARTLGITKDISSRTLKASAKKDPLAVAHLMPGPASLRQLLRAASRRSVAPSLIKEAEKAVRQFDQLIRLDAGDRISLDGIISAWLPDARERFEMSNKQAVFRGMAQLKGIMADVGITTAIVHPSQDGTMVDGVWIIGSLGLRRIRPGATIHIRSGKVVPTDEDSLPLTLEGDPTQHLRGLVLDEFCSSPVPKINVRLEGKVMHYTCAGDAIGPQSAMDLFFAEYTPRCMRRFQDSQDLSKPQNRRGPSSEITTPVKTLIFDVLLHEDVYPGTEPVLFVYDTAALGVVDMNDRARDIDRLDVAESVESLGWGVSKFRATEIPSYVNIIKHVCDRLNWDGRKFRGYRCRAQYPVYGSQICMGFTPPRASEDSN